MRIQLSEDVIVCDRETARTIWNKEPSLRHQLWLEQEFTDALLLGPEEIDKIKAKKKEKGGYIYKKGAELC